MRPGAERWLVLALALASAAPPRADAAARAGPSAPGVEERVLAVVRSTQPALWRTVAREAEAFLGLTLVHSWTMESLGEQCLVFALPAGADRERTLAELRRDRRLTGAQPVSRFHTLGTAWNDPYAGLQRSLDELGVAAAQRFATGRGVRVAVVDTGIDFEHPDLAGRVPVHESFVPGGEADFARDVHGTAVAGLLAAGAGNGVGIVGVAPEAELVALKACWSDPPGARAAVCDSYTLARALDFALTARPRVLNLSLAGPDDPLLARLIERAEPRGILVVAAADPSGASPFPASLPTVLAVAAEGEAALGAALAAPGTALLSTGPAGAYDYFDGSSFAAAQVAGAAALLAERRPALAPAELRRLLVAGARAGAGAPALSVCRALGLAIERDACR